MKRIVVSVLFLSLALFTFAKSPIKGLPKECQVQRPMYSVLKNDRISIDGFAEKGFGQQTSEPMYGYWDVYSDRSDNPTYTSASASTQYSTLGFKEKVRIARIRKGFALVYSIPVDDSSVFPALPLAVDWKGWVPMSNLVYVSKTLINSEGVYIRALLKDDMEYTSPVVLTAKLFEGPLDRFKPIELPNKINSFFYVIKEEEGMHLLATDPDISDPESIYGWVADNNLLVWDNRTALEPNWDIADYDFFSKNGIGCNLLSADGRIIGLLPFNKTSKIAASDQDTYRMKGGLWRYPVLKSKPDSYFCAVSGRSGYLKEQSKKIPVNDSGYVSKTGGEINIMFVLDGSRLYEPFYPIIAERISLLNNVGGNSGSIKVGATIYHDVRNSEFMIESFPLSDPGDSGLFDFIDQGGQYGFRDNLSEAPLLAAIQATVDNADISPDAENVIVVVGGRGDSTDNLKPDDIAGSLAAKNISVYALQVQNNSATNAYRMFNYMMSDVIQANIEDQMNVPVQSSREKNDNEISTTTVFSAHGYDSTIYDMIVSVDNGIMSEDDFSELLELVFNRIGEASFSYSSFSSVYPEFFRLVGVKRSEQNHKFFKEVALFSNEEFDSLCSMFSRLNELYLSKNPNRSLFQDILLINMPTSYRLVNEKTVVPYDSQDKIKSALNSMGYRQVLSLIEGLSEITPYYSGHALKDIMSTKSVPEEEYEFILADLSRIYYRLLAIKNTPSIYRSIINGEPHYWVPVDDLR